MPGVKSQFGKVDIEFIKSSGPDYVKSKLLIERQGRGVARSSRNFDC
jgi:hypothetical protein